MNTKNWLVIVDDNADIQDMKSRLMCAAPELLTIAEKDEAAAEQLADALQRVIIYSEDQERHHGYSASNAKIASIARAALEAWKAAK